MRFVLGLTAVGKETLVLHLRISYAVLPQKSTLKRFLLVHDSSKLLITAPQSYPEDGVLSSRPDRRVRK
jgi:hypothetical protein